MALKNEVLDYGISIIYTLLALDIGLVAGVLATRLFVSLLFHKKT